MQELREQERRQEEEKERLLEQKQVPLTNKQTNCSATVLLAVDAQILRLFVQEEDERRAKEEQERREEEEYQKLKASFVIEDQGEEEQLSEDQVSNLLTLFF